LKVPDTWPQANLKNIIKRIKIETHEQNMKVPDTWPQENLKKIIKIKTHEQNLEKKTTSTNPHS
jgi:hypothetical protein